MRIKKWLAQFAITAILGVVFLIESKSEVPRPVTAKDCVSVRNLATDERSWQSTIKISPDGVRVAYLVKSPNLLTNKNDIELHVQKLAQKKRSRNEPFLVGDISQLRWSSDSRHLFALIKTAAGRTIEMIDAGTGNKSAIVVSAEDIVEYSMDSHPNTIVFATEVPAAENGSHHTDQEIARGYRIPFPLETEMSWPRRRIFITHRTNRSWSKPVAISVESPLNGRKLSEFSHAENSGLYLSVAPDGGAFLFAYLDFSNEMPSQWRESAFIQLRNRSGMLQALQPLFLYDLRTGKCSIPLMTPWVASTPQWAADGRSFAVTGLAPVGTKFEENDKSNHILGHVSKSHLYAVNLRNSTAELVAPQMAFPWEGPLYWAPSGELFLRASVLDQIEQFAYRDGKWQEMASIRLPFKGDLQATTNGSYVVGAFSDSQTPPELFMYETSAKRSQILDRLNPQFDGLTLARQQLVHWKTSRGFDATGMLLIPPDYINGERYPLVIQTKPFANGFACSFGNFPSFAPQPIANSGIMYIARLDTDGSDQKEEDYYPEGYPGSKEAGTVSEAAFNMDLWDSGIQALDKMGLIDSKKVGIIGFSRTGWYTEFLLAHSSIHFRAATAADNVQYSVGEYWLHHDPETIDEYNHLYGGPPSGPSAQNWLKYSISFNLDKISTPLLLEEMGNGKPYEDVNMVPIDLAAAFEVFSGLSVLHRPVELFYYPNEDHTPDHPQARLSTIQRNVDWYRFWLQGYQRSNPEDPDQYRRWRRLCSDTHTCLNSLDVR